METFSALLALCAGNSPITGEPPSQRPVAWSFDVFFYLRLNKRLSKQSWGCWFETPSRSLWRHCDVHEKINLFREGILDESNYDNVKGGGGGGGYQTPVTESVCKISSLYNNCNVTKKLPQILFKQQAPLSFCLLYILHKVNMQVYCNHSSTLISRKFSKFTRSCFRYAPGTPFINMD